MFFNFIKRVVIHQQRIIKDVNNNQFLWKTLTVI